MEGKGRDPLPLQVSAHKHTNLMDSLIVRLFSLYQYKNKNSIIINIDRNRTAVVTFYSFSTLARPAYHTLLVPRRCGIAGGARD